MTLLILVGAFVGLVGFSMPVSFAMGVAAVAALMWSGEIPMNLVTHRMVLGVDSFVLLAVPLFILAGALMDAGGISNRLVRLAKAIVGHLRGGLGMVVVVGEMLFSGISGSTVADVSAISSVLLPSMRRSGYPPEYSVSIISAASAMGILIPPCIMMVVLGAIANVSVAALFLAGFLPATVLALLIMALIFYQAHPRRLNLPAEARPSLRELWRALADALLPLGMPVIIFGGILGGVFTPTEAAAVAVVYALVVGVAVYREISLRQLWSILVETGVTTGMVLFLLAVANIFSYLLAVQQVPQLMGRVILSISSSPLFFLLASGFIFLTIGGILEGLPAALIFVPIFLPLVQQLGINMLHFLILVVTAVGIGIFIPPAGIGIAIACAVGRVSMEAVVRPLIPFLLVLLVGFVILAAFPAISTIVPSLFLTQ